MTPRATRRPLATLAALVLLGATALGVSACNTVAGAGRDVSSVGHDVTGGASTTQRDISRSSNGHLATQ